MAETFDWIFFDCFNTLIDDFDEAGEEHGLCSLPAFAVDHGLFATREEFVAAYQGCRGEAYAQGREMVLTERLQRTFAVSTKVSPDAAEQARLVTAMTRIWAEEYDRLLRPTPDVAAMLAHWSARKASSISTIGNVPYSSAMPVYSACGHSWSTAVHIKPLSGAEVDEPS